MRIYTTPYLFYKGGVIMSSDPTIALTEEDIERYKEKLEQMSKEKETVRSLPIHESLKATIDRLSVSPQINKKGESYDVLMRFHKASD